MSKITSSGANKGAKETHMKKCSVLALLFFYPYRPAYALGKTSTEILGELAENTVGSVLGSGATDFLTNLGVFSVLGLGSGPDPVLNAKLDEIIGQLQVVQADITDLQNDVATLSSTFITQTQSTQLNNLLPDMIDAETNILDCIQQVQLLANAPGSDATDAQMREFALQMIGTEEGVCDLTHEFQIIHSRMVAQQNLSGIQNTFYMLLAQVAHANGMPFERVASHFVQYEIVQRQALAMIRGAWSSLGEADNLQTVFTQAPTNFLGALQDEEIAFLQAADAYITAGSPPFDPSPALLADAIVQRFEQVPSQLSTYSVSVRDDAPTFSVQEVGSPDSETLIHMDDAITGVASSYYASWNTVLNSGIASCQSTPQSDGFSYLRPLNQSFGTGFKVGSSCALHLERHLLRNPPAAMGGNWSVFVRNGFANIGAPTLRNAATLKTETVADNLALAGDHGGGGSGYSELSVVADTTNPSLVTLAIDLPGAPATPINVGTTHPFAAGGSGAIAPFTRVPFGPPFPDRYALQSGGQYLSVDGNGYAVLAATPVWFDFQRLPDGNTELDYPGGVLYVDSQYVQYFHGESDDVWANSINIASGQLPLQQWDSPLGFEETNYSIGGPLDIYPPCSNGQIPYLTEGPGLSFPTTECSDSGYPYVMYDITFTNQDNFPRAFQLTVAGAVNEPDGMTGTTYGGLHCYAPGDDHIDTDSATNGNETTAYTYTNGNSRGDQSGNGVPNAAHRNLLVPADSTFEIQCQILDIFGQPGDFVLNQFTVQPCTDASADCQVYQ